jgi:FimV-like protein
LDWYLALAYLQTGDTAAADTLLQAIAEQPDHYRRAAAERLLNR